MILLLSSLALAEPFRATGTLTAGADDATTPAVQFAADYGVVRHVAVLGEVGIHADGHHGLGAGLAVYPLDGRWARLGFALVPELADPLGDPDDAYLRGRAGLRGSWLAFWGVGLAVRADAVMSAERPLGWEWGAGLSVRM